MTPFAVTLQTVTYELRFLVKLAFLLYVLLSFIAVATYAVKQVRHGRLVDGRRSPLPFAIPPHGEWLFVLNILVLPLTGSAIYMGAILLLILALLALNQRMPRERGFMPQAAGWVFICNIVTLLFLQSPVYMLLVVGGLVLLLLESSRSAWTQFGLGRLRPTQLFKWSLLICGAVILVVGPLSDAVESAMDALHFPHPLQQTVETFRQYTRASQVVNFMIQAVVLSPFIEELFFRGFLLTFLKRYSSTWMALILSAGVFAFAHVNLGSVLPLWLLGIVLGVAYEHSGSILLPIGIHACFNLVTALNLLMDKGAA